MSIIHATNSSTPNLVGFSMMGFGAASAVSTWVTDGAMPILNFPGAGIADFSFSALTALAGYYVVKEGSPVAAWFAGGMVALCLFSVGVTVDTDQAGRMAKATVNAARNASSAAVSGVAATDTSTDTQYRATVALNPAQIKECEAGVLSWTRTAAGVRNCSIASDGKRYAWVAN